MYTFTELLPLWRQGQLTLEEISELLFNALEIFRNRSIRLDYKLLPFTDFEDLGVDFEEDIEVEIYEIAACPPDYTAICQTVDEMLTEFVLLELKLLKMERDYERLAREIDTTSSQWN